MKSNDFIYQMPFAKVYPMLVAKTERKGRTKAEVDALIEWLLGYDAQSLQAQLDKNVTHAIFYGEAPRIHTNASKITGVICGVRVEDIQDPLMQQIRWLDKLVDELAKGKPMEKILRQ
ncbi:MAG: DUF2200 domain-containing protein [Oscillospiraceae bacterium]|jgi:hypothetical protein|nr:DUF2200 domain-containing protein [Oscillospiraceae bacterium]